MASYQLDNPFIAISTDTFQLQEGDTSPNKAARIRITFTNSQREALEKEFKISPYLFKARRIEIAKRLELEEKNVKVWFQNRRMKSKKEIIPNGNKITKSYKVNHLQQTKKAVILSNVILNNTTTTTSLIKGPPNVPTTFKSHAIVQAPVPVTIGNVSQIEPQQFLCAVPQSDSLQIPFNTLFQGPISHNGMVFQPPFRLHPITFTSVGQSNLMPQIHVHGVQSQHPIVPVILHQQLLPTQPQPPKNVELKIEVPLLENNDSSGSVEKPIEFQISVDMSAAVNQDPEDSINLDAYLNDLTKRANAKKIEYQETPKVQDLPPIKTEEDDLDFNYFFNNLEKFIDPKQNDFSTEELMATTDEYSTTPLKMEVEGFDMEDFMSNLDKYASVPGLSEKNVLDVIFGNDESSAPEIDIHSLQPTLDVPTPMGNLSVGDLDRNYLLDDSLVDFKF